MKEPTQGDRIEGSPDDFARRLRRYCLENVEVRDLRTPCNGTVTLSASPRDPSDHRPVMLHTRDLDELKRWIGVPDSAVRGRSLVEREHSRAFAKGRPPAGVSAEAVRTESAAKRTLTDSASLDAVRAHARSYLFGDSALVKDARPVIERFFGAFRIPVWIFQKVTVTSGSVLAFGTGANVLLASELEIEQGGRVVSYGSLTVSVTTLRKTTPSRVAQALDLDFIGRQFFGRRQP